MHGNGMYRSEFDPLVISESETEMKRDSMTDCEVDSALGGDMTTSPERMLGSDEFSDEREENFECFGENEYKNKAEEDSVSPSLVRRDTWARSSLRRSSASPLTGDSLVPPKRWGSFRHHRPGGGQARSSAALASALFHSGPATSSSFNSSGRSSNCDDGEIVDHQSDTSLEDDVIDLNNKVQQLQEQVGVLVENQATTDDKYTRVKKDNATLTARIHMLEEHIRELEGRGEERLAEEQRRNKDIVQRLEREKTLELENFAIKLQTAEREHRALLEEASSLRGQVEKVRDEKIRVEEQLVEVQNLLSIEQRKLREIEETRLREAEEWRIENDRSRGLVEEMTKEIEELRRNQSEINRKNEDRGIEIDDGFEVLGDMSARISELETELRVLREENRHFQESNEELQAQMLNKGLEEGRNLLNNQSHNSLAAEFEAMSENEMRKALKDQQDVNIHLRSYIDNVLLNIMDKYPELLEIRNK